MVAVFRSCNHFCLTSACKQYIQVHSCHWKRSAVAVTTAACKPYIPCKGGSYLEDTPQAHDCCSHIQALCHADKAKLTNIWHMWLFDSINPDLQGQAASTSLLTPPGTNLVRAAAIRWVFPGPILAVVTLRPQSLMMLLKLQPCQAAVTVAGLLYFILGHYIPCKGGSCRAGTLRAHICCNHTLALCHVYTTQLTFHPNIANHESRALTDVQSKLKRTL